MHNLWNDNAAQLSAELIVVLAAVLAVAVVAVSSLRDTAASGDKIVGRTSKKLMRGLR